MAVPSKAQVADRVAPASRPMLCLVTDRGALRRGSLEDAVARAVAAGVDQVQIRDRELDGAALLAHADAVARAARGARAGVRVVVNRRIDVALAAGLDGAHLGFDAVGAADARALLGDTAWLGASTHRPGERDTDAQLLDSVHLAPVFAPLSKASERPPLGLEVVAHAARGLLPVLAQGGVTVENAAACVAAGAAGVAVTGEILMADDPGAAAAALRAALDHSRVPATPTKRSA